ncbi:DUF3744 domain-containing protein ['Fragaria x ananassa' phyllody phytoplasma]|uniref:DUF3744 domain-containing protein n=1 Tax='Fragaria x ananassa' phyllody phytoplasma TaxID=2358428 RepID=A0ABS5K2P7_9MOLU|nr:DUF3744 domain-containing protein ['Fragaria x ananassa' phyllody phytoplasma]MBS2126130.1 DUF3744 domain-containing protein ['Fragaria x ananassa' phyllody phytoplasma]
MKKPLIIFKDFSFRYYNQKKNTLKNLNIIIYQGEKTLIIGKNGSGKSTFLKCINGLIPHSYPGQMTGSVMIKGRSLIQTSIFDLSSDVGTIMQDTDNQFVGLTVAEDMAFALENDCVTVSQMQQQVNQWSEKLNLKYVLDKKPQDLSEGTKQLVAMAGVLIYNPAILLFDEALSNLDSWMQKKITTLIKQIHDQNQNTILVVEHCLEHVLDDSFDRVIVFNDGQIIADMSSDQIIQSKILLQQGVQEPTYLNLLRYTEINLTKINNLLNLEKMQVADLAQEFMIFLDKITRSVPISQPSTPYSLEPLLQLVNISYENEQAQAKEKSNILNDISLTLHAGEMISILGENGCGKSILAKIMAGLLIPSKGEIKWQGEHLCKIPWYQKVTKIGFVSQNPYHMISQKTVFEEVALGLLAQKLTHQEIQKRVQFVLNICDLTSLSNSLINSLSFGQKKRLTISAILALQPQIIILDEPTMGQDFYHYTKLMLFLEKLNQTGTTIVIITNDLSLALTYTHKTWLLSEGTIMANNTPISILNNNVLMKKAGIKPMTMTTFLQKLSISIGDKMSLFQKITTLNKEIG